MHRELDSVLYEAVVYSMDYSALRRNNRKWESEQMTISAVLEKFRSPNKVIIQIIRDTNGRSALLIQRKRGENTFILLSDFINRIKIKRSVELFQLIYSIWTSVNPNHIKTINRKLYKNIVTCISRALFGSFSQIDLDHDINLDFGSYKDLVFSQFYDSVFELVDNGARTGESGQYLSVAYRAQQAILNAPWLQNSRPEFKVIKDQRPTYHSWMLPFLTQGKSDNFAEEISMTLI